MKVTTSYCDFNNPNVKPHGAQFEIRDADAPNPLTEIDSCAPHLAQVMMDHYRTGSKKLIVVKLSDANTLPEEKKESCEVCGREYKSKSGLNAHRTKKHGGKGR